MLLSSVLCFYLQYYESFWDILLNVPGFCGEWGTEFVGYGFR